METAIIVGVCQIKMILERWERWKK
jgi:hypothetical protein